MEVMGHFLSWQHFMQISQSGVHWELIDADKLRLRLSVPPAQATQLVGARRREPRPDMVMVGEEYVWLDTSKKLFMIFAYMVIFTPVFGYMVFGSMVIFGFKVNF